MIAVTAAEMRALDRWTIEHGTPGHVLMERAGSAAARVLRERLRRPRGPVVVVCGRGNNGGDGFVVARHLKRARIPVEVWLAAEPETVRGDAARMLQLWRRGRGPVHDLLAPGRVDALARRLERAAVVVDALFGTGLNAPVTGVPAATIAAINASGAPVLAVDIASGLSADTGSPLGIAVVATVTATFGFPKIGQLVHPGVDHTGLLAVVDIGIPAAAVAAVNPRSCLLEAEEVGALLPPRPRNAHKGSFGHVLVIAGSRGKTGAALLAAEGSVRAGAGLTTLAVAAELQLAFEGRVREVMTTAWPATDADWDELLAGRTAVVCGPGLGLSEASRKLVAEAVRRVRVPLVLDADGLNAVAGTTLLRERPAPTIVTPHPGEMARLVGRDTAAVQADRPGAARAYAASENVVVVLKGAHTIVAAADGGIAISPTGNPGMASGGTGDVLAGVVGALLGQRLLPFDAAALGVFAHGGAGDAVAARRGEVGLAASDLLFELPPMLAALQAAARPDVAPAAGAIVQVCERVTETADETEALAAALGRVATDGVLIGLVGDLGAGKTCFVRGLARGLGVDPERVHSPTFTIATEYPGGRLRLQHVDLYRFPERVPDDPWLRETLYGDGVTAVEWFDRLVDAPDDALVVTLRALGADLRAIRLEARGARHEALLASALPSRDHCGADSCVSEAIRPDANTTRSTKPGDA